MLCYYHRTNTASDIECSRDLHVSGLASLYQLIKQAIGNRLIENPLISKAVVVELERFQFDTKLMGDVLQVNRREVWLTSFRADRCELGAGVNDRVVAMRSWVGEGLDGSHGETLSLPVCRNHYRDFFHRQSDIHRSENLR